MNRLFTKKKGEAAAAAAVDKDRPYEQNYSEKPAGASGLNPDIPGLKWRGEVTCKNKLAECAKGPDQWEQTGEPVELTHLDQVAVDAAAAKAAAAAADTKAADAEPQAAAAGAEPPKKGKAKAPVAGSSSEENAPNVGGKKLHKRKSRKKSAKRRRPRKRRKSTKKRKSKRRKTKRT